ncbi:hypothetical protein Dimus_001174 [Dionaea muscipula]
MSFVDGWEQNFFISKWNMHQLLIECPSIYELMACPEFQWENTPLLQIWRKKNDQDVNNSILLESYSPEEIVPVLKEALISNMVEYDGVNIPLPFNLEILKWATETCKILSSAVLPSRVKFYNIYGMGLETPHSVCYGSENSPVNDVQQIRNFPAIYTCLDGDGTVPIESAKADGLNAEARVGVPGEHRGILGERHVFRILKHWLKAGEPDPYYDPLNDFVILPTAWEMGNYIEKCFRITSVKEGWEIIPGDLDKQDDKVENTKPIMTCVSVSMLVDNEPSQVEGKRQAELNALHVSVKV